MRLPMPPALCLCLCLCFFAGCAVPHTGMDRPPVADLAPIDPTQSELDLWRNLRQNTPQAPKEESDDAEFLHTPKNPAVSLTCQLPLNRATDRAWALTDENLLPPDLAALWHANGLRVGVLRADQWGKFRQALNQQEKNAKTQPGVQTQNRTTFAIRPFPTPLHCGGPLPRGLKLPIDRTLPPMAPTADLLDTFEGDRAQLLALGHFTNGQLTGLTLTPHLFRPTPMVMFDIDRGPPKAWEKAVQGQAIDPLIANLRPHAGELVVLGLYWPWKTTPPPQAQPPAPKGGEKSAPGDAAKDPAKSQRNDNGKAQQKKEPGDDLFLAATPPPLPLTFGRALFTSTQSDGETQTLVVFETQ